MEQLHVHEVPRMMKGNGYTETSLRAVTAGRFGEHQCLYTYSADNMEVDELIGFLKWEKKFMPAGEEFTVDINKVRSHRFSVADDMIDKPIGQLKGEMLVVVDYAYRFP